jgi:hypothetical protein
MSARDVFDKTGNNASYLDHICSQTKKKNEKNYQWQMKQTKAKQ